MREKVLFWSSLMLGTVAFLFFVANVALINSNRALQQNAQERQVFINNMQNLSNLNRELAQALSDIAAKEKDQAVRDLLSSQGIVIADPKVSEVQTSAENPNNKPKK